MRQTIVFECENPLIVHHFMHAVKKLVEEKWKVSEEFKTTNLVFNGLEGEQDLSIQILNKDGTQGNSPMDDATGVHGSNQEQLQGDGQVQQDDDREGNRISDAREQASSDGERTTPGIGNHSFKVKLGNETWGRPNNQGEFND